MCASAGAASMLQLHHACYLSARPPLCCCTDDPQMAVCSYVSRPGNMPVLVALLPQPEELDGDEQVKRVLEDMIIYTETCFVAVRATWSVQLLLVYIAVSSSPLHPTVPDPLVQNPAHVAPPLAFHRERSLPPLLLLILLPLLLLLHLILLLLLQVVPPGFHLISLPFKDDIRQPEGDPALLARVVNAGGTTGHPPRANAQQVCAGFWREGNVNVGFSSMHSRCKGFLVRGGGNAGVGFSSMHSRCSGFLVRMHSRCGVRLQPWAALGTAEQLVDSLVTFNFARLCVCILCVFAGGSSSSHGQRPQH